MHNYYAFWFIALWLYRYLRLLINTLAYHLHTPIPLPTSPAFTHQDTTVIIPTHGTLPDPHLADCLVSIRANNPAAIIIVTPDPEPVGEVLRGLEWEWTTLPVDTTGVVASSSSSSSSSSSISTSSSSTDALGENTTTTTPTTTTIHLLTSPEANKRYQILHALPQVLTPILLLADDDVIWPPHFLPHILAPFRPDIGAVGPTVTLSRPTPDQDFTAVDFLGTAYLLRWRFNLLAASMMTGRRGVLPCLSGRTCAVRSWILKDVRFAHGYSHEFFDVGFGLGLGLGLGGVKMGKRRVHLDKVDDDNFVTRWLRDEGWGVVVQSAREAEIKTVLKREFWGAGGGGGGGFVGQCVRWARTTWRSNWTSLRNGGGVLGGKKGGVGWWGGYAVLASSFNPPAVVMEGVLWWLLLRACDEEGCCFWGTVGKRSTMVGFAVWIFLTKTVKLWGHFWRYPRDLKFLPASIAFGYFHGAIKIFTLLTIHWTTWEGGKEEVVPPPVEGLEEKDCLVCGAEEKGRSAENGVRRRS